MGDMKVIFLDIDGVLNANDDNIQRYLLRLKEAKDKNIPLKQDNSFVNKTRDKYGMLFDERCVKWLGYIIECTGAKIVISSTWRLRGLTVMQSMWKERDLPGDVIDVTKTYWHKGFENKHKDTDYERWRGVEIEKYLEEHPDIESYVIFDDDSDMLPNQIDNFLKCDAMFGITNIEAERAIKILNK